MSDQENLATNDNANDLSGTNQTSISEETTKTNTVKSNETHAKLSSLPDEWADEIRELRKENAQRRLREKESEKKVEDSRKLADEARETLSQLKDFKESIFKDLKDTREKVLASEKRAITAQLEVEARKAGVVDLEIFQKIVDSSSLKLSDDGRVAGLEEVIKNTKQKHPILFDNRISRNTGNPGINPKPAQETKRDLTGLSKKDYKKDKDAFLRNIRQNY